MNLKVQTEIHARALEVVQRFKSAEAALLTVLQEIDAHKIYLNYECRNLFEYATKVLSLTESIAFNFITVARKAKEVPMLQQAIQSGALSVSKARKITPVLSCANQAQWVAMAIELPQKKLEQEVARAAPQEALPEKLKFISGDRLSLHLTLSENLSRKLRRAQDLESQRRRQHATLEETLEALIDLYLEKNDPIKKAERNAPPVARQVEGKNPGAANVSKMTESAFNSELRSGAGANLESSASTASDSNHSPRAPIAAAIKHQVYQRDQGQCTFRDKTGARCSEQRWIDIHHIIPKCEGGLDSLENLTTLCSGHHRLTHSRHRASTQSLRLSRDR